MNATLTELRRDTSRITRAADDGREVTLTEHGKPRFSLKAIKPVDRKGALALLRSMGSIELPSRK